ncbi:MAG: hypothetical protein Q4G05_00585 [Clostridia bacterium]|nr:hypothetical protein [Clostridia bacterium]
MNIEKKLKKDGIEIISPLKYSTIQNLADSISTNLCNTFPELKLDYSTIYDKLSSLSMYYITMPEGMSEANYLYRNSSIYFKYGLEEEHLEKFATHECLHFLQTITDDKGHLLKLGLCDLSGYKVYGLALNEAAVQYMTSQLLKEHNDTVKYYGISFNTCSPLIYPLLCCLISQMAYITSEYILFNSTFFSTENFKKKFSELCGSEKVYRKIEENFNTIFYTEEKIIQLSNKLSDDNLKGKKNILLKIEKLKQYITSTFLETQNLIYSSYFNNSFESLFNKDSISNFRNKLYRFKNYLGTVEGDNSFDNYYLDMMIKLDDRDNVLQNSTYLTTIKSRHPLLIILDKLRNLFTRKSMENEDL